MSDFPLRYKCRLKQVGIVLNVKYKIIKLITEKVISQNDALVLELIWMGTAWAHNRGNQHRESYDLVLEDMADLMKIRVDNLIQDLNSLEKKKLISRGESKLIYAKRNLEKKAGRSKIKEHIEHLGLNKEVFGQILTNHQIKQNVLFLKTKDSSSSDKYFSSPRSGYSSELRKNTSQHVDMINDLPLPLLSSPASSLALSPVHAKSEDLKILLGKLLKEYPNDQRRIIGAYKLISDQGYRSRKVNSPLAWLLVSWKDIRNEFDHFDPLPVKKEKYEDESEFYGKASEEARKIAMTSWKVGIGK